MGRIPVIILLVLLVTLQACADYDILLMDCGVNEDSDEFYYGLYWIPDSRFIDTGRTEQVSSGNNDNNFPQPMMNTLRYFSEGDREHCYTLSLDNSLTYIFRAGFYYGNYDGKSQPPVFDLFLGGQIWATVNTSATDQPIFHELVYQPKNTRIQVCLRGIKDGGNPFISTLEATCLDSFLGNYLYRLMEYGTAYHLVSRLNFGGDNNVTLPVSGYTDACEELLNRYWIPHPMPGYTDLTFEEPEGCSGNLYDNQPPNSVFNTAISPSDPSMPIYVPINLPDDNPQSAYIVLYFHQRLNENITSNFTRNMDIYINSFIRGTVKLDEIESGEVLSLNPVSVQGVVNITVAPGEGTVLPPLLNGMEVFISSKLSDELSDGSKKVPYSIMVQMFTIFWLFHIFVFSS